MVRICRGCNRFTVLCDLDPMPCENCDCPSIDDLPPEWRWWLELYDRGNP